MKKSGGPKKVILAIDVKAEDSKLTKRICEGLKPFVKEKNIIIEPVTILNREDIAMGNYLKSRIGSIRKATERHLDEQLAGLGLPGLSAAKVIFADGSSTQMAVMALLNHAKKTECELIAISSHARKGLKRFLLGSFAETLSLQSSIPLLVVNPHQRTDSKDFKKVLFPTDFSSASIEGLEIVCDSFQKIQTHLILFHSYTIPIQFSVEPFVNYPLPQSEIDLDFKRTEKMGLNWCKELRNRGISCEFLIDRKSDFVISGILAAAKRNKVGMIAMVSTTGKWGARILGSVTRQVLRESPRPVWIVHPSQRKKPTLVGNLKRANSEYIPQSALLAAASGK